MRINTYPMGEYGANCYLIIDESSKDAVVIDPGANGESLIKEIERLGGSVKAILLTHAHFDHIGAVEELKTKYNISVYVHEGEVENSKLNSNVYSKLPSDCTIINDGDIWIVGSMGVLCATEEELLGNQGLSGSHGAQFVK